MQDLKYTTKLREHLGTYRESVLGAPAGVWGVSRREYKHILRHADRRLNIVPSLRDSFWQTQAARGWTLHRYFHHLSSSQAFAFNLLYPLYPEIPTGFRETRNALRLARDSQAALDFEVMLPGGDGTNIDALITEDNGRRTVIEIKLTKAAFGRAKRDERHLKKLKELYRPMLQGRLPEPLLEPEAFFADYQLFRNLAQLRPGSDDRLLLVLPRGRQQLWQFVEAWCKRDDLGSFCSKINAISIEDVLGALRRDVTTLEQSTSWLDEVEGKYFPQPQHGP